MDTMFARDKFTILDIAPFSPGSEERLAREMVEYRDRTGENVVLYCLSFHPEGRPAIAKAAFLVESYRKLRRALEGSGIRLGVLIQSLLGHWPAGGGNREPWTRSVTLEGKEKRFCPLDPGCRTYLRDVARMVAAEHPCFVLLDDDVHANGFFGQECFCERHVARFNAENGTAHTPESLRAAVAGCQPGDAVCAAFQKLQRQFVDDLVGVVRSAIDEVDPAIPAGACTPGGERRFAGDVARRVAARGQTPVLRIDNALYNQRSLVNFAGSLAHTMAMRDFHAAVPCLLDESDTFPHNRWSVPASLLAMKLQGAAFCGLRGSKLWFCNAHKGTFPVSRAYTDALAEMRGQCSAIVKAANGSELSGIVVPVVGGRGPWHPSMRSEPFVGDGNWGVGMAGGFGVPFRCGGDFAKDALHALGGAEAVERLGDDELSELFRHRVLVDGAAAVALTKRGLSHLTGVRATECPLGYTFERDADGGATYEFWQGGAPLLEPLAPDAEIVTELCRSPFAGSPEVEVVAPGMVRTTNALGGRVVTTAFFAKGHGMFQPALTDMRKAWFLKALSKLGWDDWAVLNDQDATVLERRRPDGTTLLAIFNTGFDELGPIRLRAPFAPGTVELLGPHGDWHRIDATSPASGERELPVRLPCAHACVVALRRFT